MASNHPLKINFSATALPLYLKHRIHSPLRRTLRTEREDIVGVSNALCHHRSLRSIRAGSLGDFPDCNRGIPLVRRNALPERAAWLALIPRWQRHNLHSRCDDPTVRLSAWFAGNCVYVDTPK